MEKSLNGIFILPIEGIFCGSRQKISKRSIKYVKFICNSNSLKEGKLDNQISYENYKNVAINRFIESVCENYCNQQKYYQVMISTESQHVNIQV